MKRKIDKEWFIAGILLVFILTAAVLSGRNVVQTKAETGVYIGKIAGTKISFGHKLEAERSALTLKLSGEHASDNSKIIPSGYSVNGVTANAYNGALDFPETNLSTGSYELKDGVNGQSDPKRYPNANGCGYFICLIGSHISGNTTRDTYNYITSAVSFVISQKADAKVKEDTGFKYNSCECSYCTTVKNYYQTAVNDASLGYFQNPDLSNLVKDGVEKGNNHYVANYSIVTAVNLQPSKIASVTSLLYTPQKAHIKIVQAAASSTEGVTDEDKNAEFTYGIYSDPSLDADTLVNTVSLKQGETRTIDVNGNAVYYIKQLSCGDAYTPMDGVTDTNLDEGEKYTMTTTGDSVSDIILAPSLTYTYKASSKLNTATLEVQKRAYDSQETDWDKASLKGAEYTIYRDEDCKKELQTITLSEENRDSEPYAYGTTVLAYGTYYIKETKSPEGFAQNNEVGKIVLSSKTVQNKKITYKTADKTKPSCKKKLNFKLTFVKEPKDTSWLNLDGYADMSAKFFVFKTREDAENASEKNAYNEGKAIDEIITETNGVGVSEITYENITQDEENKWHNQTYYVREVKAPNNYKLDNTVWKINPKPVPYENQSDKTATMYLENGTTEDCLNYEQTLHIKDDADLNRGTLNIYTKINGEADVYTYNTLLHNIGDKKDDGEYEYINNDFYKDYVITYEIYKNKECTEKLDEVSCRAGEFVTRTEKSGDPLFLKQKLTGKGKKVFEVDSDIQEVILGTNENSYVFFNCLPKKATIGISLTTDKRSEYSSWKDLFIQEIYEDKKAELEEEGKSEEDAKEEALTYANKQTSLGGIRYTLYKDEDCTEEVTRIQFDKNGNGTEMDITFGTYYIKESTNVSMFKAKEKVLKISLRPDYANESDEYKHINIEKEINREFKTLNLKAGSSTDLLGSAFILCSKESDAEYYLDEVKENNYVSEEKVNEDLENDMVYFAKYIKIDEEGNEKLTVPSGTYYLVQANAASGYKVLNEYKKIEIK